MKSNLSCTLKMNMSHNFEYQSAQRIFFPTLPSTFLAFGWVMLGSTFRTCGRCSMITQYFFCAINWCYLCHFHNQSGLLKCNYFPLILMTLVNAFEYIYHVISTCVHLNIYVFEISNIYIHIIFGLVCWVPGHNELNAYNPKGLKLRWWGYDAWHNCGIVELKAHL